MALDSRKQREKDNKRKAKERARRQQKKEMLEECEQMADGGTEANVAYQVEARAEKSIPKQMDAQGHGEVANQTARAEEPTSKQVDVRTMEPTQMERSWFIFLNELL